MEQVDVDEDVDASFFKRGIFRAIDTFLFQHAKESFARGIVTEIADRAYG